MHRFTSTSAISRYSERATYGRHFSELAHLVAVGSRCQLKPGASLRVPWAERPDGAEYWSAMVAWAVAGGGKLVAMAASDDIGSDSGDGSGRDRLAEVLASVAEVKRA